MSTVASRLHAAVRKPGPRLITTRIILTLEDAVALDQLLRDHAERCCDDCGDPLDEDYGIAYASPTCGVHDVCIECATDVTCAECRRVLDEVEDDRREQADLDYARGK